MASFAFYVESRLYYPLSGSVGCGLPPTDQSHPSFGDLSNLSHHSPWFSMSSILPLTVPQESETTTQDSVHFWSLPPFQQMASSLTLFIFFFLPPEFKPSQGSKSPAVVFIPPACPFYFLSLLFSSGPVLVTFMSTRHKRVIWEEGRSSEKIVL